MKPGYKTTEFWVTIVLTLMAVIAPLISRKFGIREEGVLQIIDALALVFGISGPAYIWRRGTVKAVHEATKHKNPTHPVD